MQATRLELGLSEREVTALAFPPQGLLMEGAKFVGQTKNVSVFRRGRIHIRAVDGKQRLRRCLPIGTQ